jgi:hypothetical protein
MSITVVNLKDKPTPDYDIYIGRANKWLNLEESKWHNPFVKANEADRDRVILQYEEYIRCREDLIEALPELAGKALACFCSPKKCHGHVLQKLYEEFCVKNDK